MTLVDHSPAPPPPVNVLVVDDVAQNLVAMEALLRRDGLRVLKAASGAEALELLLEHDVALALLDVQMPEMDGFALAELMRGTLRTRDVPIIFLTASPNDPVRAFQGYESGAVDFLHKPIDSRVVASKVNVFVELFQQRQQLHARNEALERMLKLNETMIAVLTHDLRTPLSAINMGTEVLKLHAKETVAANTLARIKNSTQRMARMIDQLLDFSRIRGQTLRLQYSNDHLGQLVESVVAEVRQATPDVWIDLSATGDLHGAFDASRIAQVVSNLIANAVQHGAHRTPVSVRVDGQHEDRLRVSVSNIGHIPDELLPRLFEPFKGNTGSGAPRENLGLGLYIVDQFIKAHGGQVTATNTPEGALFQFDIPRLPPPRTA